MKHKTKLVLASLTLILALAGKAQAQTANDLKWQYATATLKGMDGKFDDLERRVRDLEVRLDRVEAELEQLADKYARPYTPPSGSTLARYGSEPSRYPSYDTVRYQPVSYPSYGRDSYVRRDVYLRPPPPYSGGGYWVVVVD